MDPSTRDLTLQAIHDLEFAPDPVAQPAECASCAAKNPALRCLNCFDPQFLCSRCIVEQHAQNPLHRIEMLTPTGFVGSTLKTAGLRIQLGHPLYKYCPHPIPDNDFAILDGHGMHEVSLDYCGCPSASSHARQLRDARFYPSSEKAPHTAVAFTVAHTIDVHSTPISMRVRRRTRR